MSDAKRILIAPTAYKGTLSAAAAARALADGWRSVRPQDELLVVPIGDGGDGSLDMIESAHGVTRRTSPARDALGRLHDAPYVVFPNGIAFIESASVVGLALLRLGEADIMRASTAGVGDLIRHLAKAGARRIAVGVGGTSSNDAGIGMMAAIGVRFEGVDGDLLGGGDLAGIRGIDLSEAHELLRDVEMIGISDVVCPLYGPGGAAERFAAQKGASPDQVRELDDAMRDFSHLAERSYGIRLNGLKHGGAGGGLGAGLHLGCNARLVSGVDWLIRKCNLTRFIRSVDVVVTGEGKFDHTSLQGKAPFRMTKIAQRAGKTVLLAAGQLGIEHDELIRIGFLDAVASGGEPLPTDDHAAAISHLARRLAQRASDLGDGSC